MTRPTLDRGFRIRNASPTRVDAFVDAAFAFAASFHIVSRSWQVHRAWSRRYGIEDACGARLSLALVFLMLVCVYPLRTVAELTLASFSGGWPEETPIVVHTVVLAAILPMGRGSALPCDLVPGLLYLLLIPMIRFIAGRGRRELGAPGVAEPAT